MFSLGVKCLLNKPRVFCTILQSPPKCFDCRQVYNKSLHLYSGSNCVLLGFCRRLSILIPKEEKNENNMRRHKKRKVSSSRRRRPVTFTTADFIYNLQEMSDSSTFDKETLNETSLKNRPRYNFPKISDFKEVNPEILLQLLRDNASSSTRISQNQIHKLENAFVYNIKQYTVLEMFLIARYFFLLQHRAPKYLTTFFEYIDNNFDEVVSFEGDPLSRTMFYIYFHGSCPESLLQKIEHHLSTRMEELSLNDIGLACLGYFRANRRIRSFELLDQIAEKTIEQFSTLKLHHLINILKSFRHGGYGKISYFERLADLLVSEKTLCDMRLNQVMHVIMAFASTRIYHPELIHQCMQRSVELVQSSPTLVRTKELGRIVWAAGTLGVDDQDLDKVRTLVDAHSKIEKSSEMTRNMTKSVYPESISDTVMGSVFLKIFPHDLISLMLEEKTVNILQGLRGLEKRMQMLFIHHTVNIECPNYTGPKLKQFHVEQFELDDRKRAVQFELDTRPGLFPLFQELSSILGEKNVHCHMILPHFTTADIEIHLDAENKPVVFEPETLSTDDKKLMWKNQHHVTSDLLQMLKNPSQNLASDSRTPQISRRIAILVTGHNQCALNDPNQLLGFHRTKIRQLSAMDYEVLLLMPADIADLKDEICPERRKQWVFQNVIQKLNIPSDGQNL